MNKKYLTLLAASLTLIGCGSSSGTGVAVAPVVSSQYSYSTCSSSGGRTILAPGGIQGCQQRIAINLQGLQYSQYLPSLQSVSDLSGPNAFDTRQVLAPLDTVSLIGDGEMETCKTYAWGLVGACITKGSLRSELMGTDGTSMFPLTGSFQSVNGGELKLGFNVSANTLGSFTLGYGTYVRIDRCIDQNGTPFACPYTPF